ncbi:MAG TPA: GtrA family protein [Candidatus Saccharimonadales bacterium]|nr:GtrA family protein [Candidatus Saccharimonadales bacterium]
MSAKDTYYSVAAAIVTAAFLVPTLTATSIYAKIPFPLILIFIVFPIVSILGMTIVAKLSKMAPILWQLAKFAQVGVLNTAIDFGILNFLIGYTHITSGTGIIVINAISFTVALINSYFWNKNWVFAGKTKANFVTFAVVTVIGLLINTGVVYGLTTYVAPIIVSTHTLWANVAKLLATGLSLVWNFSGYKVIVFKGSSSK